MSSSTDNTTTNCAACGKEGGNLNMCNKCNMVKYCNAACKKKHRSKHKKACEKRVAELHVEALFKDPPPPEECPICLLPLSLDSSQTIFKSCCGKRICCGCIYAMSAESRGRGKVSLCAFCRTPASTSEPEEIKRIQKLMDANNAHSFCNFAEYYDRGIRGMQQDDKKANELFLTAGELGCADAYYNLGHSYYNGEGVEVDKKKAKYYWELAAMNGVADARYMLGITEGKVGNHYRAFKHFVLAARAGYKNSLDKVKEGFMTGYVTKDEYANTLLAYQSQQDEMESDTRDKARAHINNGVMRM